MVFSNPLSFSFTIPNINGKHKDKTIITNIPYAILNICLISDILQKISSFSSRNVRRFNFISYICTAFKNNMKVTI